MKAILLPTDFSNNSVNAINYAMELFKDVECQFYILNVQKASSFITDDMMVVASSATIYNTIIDASKKSISNIISKVIATYNKDDEVGKCFAESCDICVNCHRDKKRTYKKI